MGNEFGGLSSVLSRQKSLSANSKHNSAQHGMIGSPCSGKTRNELVSKVNYLRNQINTEFKVEISKLSGGAVEAIKLLFSTMFSSYIQNEKCHLEQINYKKMRAKLQRSIS